MKKVLLMIVAGCFAGLLSLTSCKDGVDDFDLTKDPLDGKIEGADWAFTVGNANRSTSGNQMSCFLLGKDISDACAVRASFDPYIYLRFPPAKGTYNIGFNSVEVIFSYKNQTKQLNAYAGYIQIVYVSSTTIIGYLSADIDDDNVVEGSFSLNVCS